MGRMIFESKVVLAFDQRGVSAAVLGRGGRTGGVQARSEAPLAAGALVASALEDNLRDPGAVRAALRSVHQELGGNGRRAVLLLPEGVARLALVEAQAGVKPAAFARFRLLQGLPYAASEALVDGVAVGRRGFLAGAVRRAVVRGYESAVAEAGFSQDRVEPFPLWALATLLRVAPRAEPLLAVVLGDAACTLAYFAGGQLRLLRSRRRGQGSGEPARLAAELRRTAGLAGGDSGLPAVAVAGADAGWLAAELRAEGWQADAAEEPPPAPVEWPVARR